MVSGASPGGEYRLSGDGGGLKGETLFLLHRSVSQSYPGTHGTDTSDPDMRLMVRRSPMPDRIRRATAENTSRAVLCVGGRLMAKREIIAEIGSRTELGAAIATGVVVGMVTMILTVLVFLPCPIAAAPRSITPPQVEAVQPSALAGTVQEPAPAQIDWQALEAKASLDWAKGAADKLQARTPQEAAQAEVKEAQAIEEHEAAEAARKAIAAGTH